jgi:azurin
MNIRVLLVPVFALSLLAGCGQKGPATSSEPASGSSAASGSATAPANGPKTVEITANDQMKFSVTSIEAKPGEEIHVVLTNTGTLPKEAMAHNWVLLKAGSDAAAFSAAAATAKDKDYIPDNLKDEIIAKIDLLGPRKSGEVTFKAPDQPGEYPFLCSFPAHYAVGMKGTLTVR